MLSASFIFSTIFLCFAFLKIKSLSYNFLRLKDHDLFQKILLKAEEGSEFAKGVCLDEGFDENIKYLDKQSQDRLSDICKHVNQRYGYNKNKFSLADYPIIGFPKNMYYSYTNEGDKGENVIDDDMKEYLQMVLDEMNTKNNSSAVS